MKKLVWPNAVKASRRHIWSDSLKPVSLTRGQQCQLIGLVRGLKRPKKSI